MPNVYGMFWQGLSKDVSEPSVERAEREREKERRERRPAASRKMIYLSVTAVQETFHGPTLSFKDLSMGFLLKVGQSLVWDSSPKSVCPLCDHRTRRPPQQVLGYFMESAGASEAAETGATPTHLELLVATSGDTGPAGAAASLGLEGVLDYTVLYPAGMISPEQAQQMTAMDAPNVHVRAITGP